MRHPKNMRYPFHPPGRFDPFELNHYIGNHLSGAIDTIMEGRRPKLGVVRYVLSGLLQRYADGTYQYRHSDEFNPCMAQTLRNRVEEIVRPGATAKELGDLAENLLLAVDRHYKAVDPSKTRKAIRQERAKLRAERHK